MKSSLPGGSQNENYPSPQQNKNHVDSRSWEVKTMEITVKGEAKEIAALVLAVQERQYTAEQLKIAIVTAFYSEFCSISQL